jgi:hypothetical protein
VRVLSDSARLSLLLLSLRNDFYFENKLKSWFFGLLLCGMLAMAPLGWPFEAEWREDNKPTPHTTIER